MNKKIIRIIEVVVCLSISAIGGFLIGHAIKSLWSIFPAFAWGYFCGDVLVFCDEMIFEN